MSLSHHNRITMFNRLFFLLSLITGIGTTLSGQPITIKNPILAGFYPDPSILKVEKDYYLINSTFSYFPGIPVFHSRDLKNWKQIGHVIDRPGQMDFLGERMTRGLFAPAISFYKGLYYVTCTDIDHDGNFVVTASKPEGPWSQPVKLPEVRGIDPSLYFDEESGKAYIVYNSDAPDNKPMYSGHRTLRMYEFDYKNLRVTGEQQILVNGGVDISQKPVWIEGPHILKRNGWYYLYAAEGGTSVNHSEVVLRSRDVWGPYVAFEHNPILTQRHLDENRPRPITSAGHAQFVEGPDGKTYVVFLAVRPYEGDYYNTGRETFLAPVKWENDWPIVDLGGEEIPYSFEVDFPEVKQKKAKAQTGKFVYTTQFRKKLEPELVFMRSYDESMYDLSRKKGLSLSLRPETISGFGLPAFIGKRQQHLYGSAETKLDFVPTSEKEHAGLVVFQNENHHYSMVKTLRDGKFLLVLFQASENKDSLVELASVALSGQHQPLKLKITAKADVYNFEYAEGESDYRLLLGKVDAKFLSTKVAGGFIGCMYGLYASSNGDASNNKAFFKYLTYEGDDEVH